MIRSTLSATLIASSALVLVIAGPASAFSLTKLVHAAGHAVGSAEKDVGHAASTVGHDVGKAERAVGHAAASATRDVGHDVGKAERTVGHVVADTGRDAGRIGGAAVKLTGRAADITGTALGNGTRDTVRFINKNAARPLARETMDVTAKALDVSGSVMDRAGNLTNNIPIVQAAGPLLHDTSKAIQSPAAHYGAAIGLGLFVGGGGLAPQTAGYGATTAGRAAFAAGSGGETGYYSRQIYLGAKCSNQTAPTKTCTRLQSKP